MFCPECKAEYLPGVTRCADCDVALVEKLPHSEGDLAEEFPDSDLQKVWSGESQDECVAICQQLKDAEIPFKVIAHKSEVEGVDQEYEIGVPAEFHSQVKEIIGGEGEDFSDAASDPANLELPAEDGKPDSVELDDDWDPDKWDPEDATVEIWVKGSPQNTDMIQSSLLENHIHSRVN